MTPDFVEEISAFLAAKDKYEEMLEKKRLKEQQAATNRNKR